jgi:DNA-binding NtrC family response regulator
MSAGHILVVDDEPDIRTIVQEILEDENYTVTVAESATAARTAFAARRPDLVLLDIWMPDTDGITLLKEWSHEQPLNLPVVMMSGHGTVETAVEAIRLGAYDFIEKPLSTTKLLVTVDHALQHSRLRLENQTLRRLGEVVTIPVGRSKLMKELRTTLERIAAHDSRVLIRGEPGSGKEVAARYLHHMSPRRERPFVELNLTAVPASNMAVRLFGAETPGEISIGVLEQAAGGTLFLDQIGDLSLDAQARLLSVLEEQRFLRIDGKTPLVLDVRIVAASSRDLAALVQSGQFREDLYYHLNVVPITVPPLREHREDVPELVGFFVDWMVEHEHLPYKRFSTAALNLLRNHPWPGNIRELRNLVQRLLILGTGEEIGEPEVSAALGAAPALPLSAGASANTLYNLPLREARDQFEKDYLEHHLKRTGGNVAEVAELIGVERTHLYRKLKGLGIDIKGLKDD